MKLDEVTILHRQVQKRPGYWYADILANKKAKEYLCSLFIMIHAYLTE